jgi:DNA-binding NtrC family response regulator
MEHEASQGWVLVVDDFSNWRELLEDTLSQAGYAVRGASSREEAWRWLDSQVFDVAVVDVVFESGVWGRSYGGAQLLEEMVRIRRARGTQLVSITGQPIPEDVQARIDGLGLIASVQKWPWGNQAFLDVVERGVLQARSTRRATSEDEAASTMDQST